MRLLRREEGFLQGGLRRSQEGSPSGNREGNVSSPSSGEELSEERSARSSVEGLRRSVQLVVDGGGEVPRRIIKEEN